MDALSPAVSLLKEYVGTFIANTPILAATIVFSFCVFLFGELTS